jgi:hypothetical protein
VLSSNRSSSIALLQKRPTALLLSSSIQTLGPSTASAKCVFSVHRALSNYFESDFKTTWIVMK